MAIHGKRTIRDGGNKLKLKKIKTIFCLSLLFLGLLTTKGNVIGAETSNGGQVSTTSKINFYEVKKEKPTTKPSSSKPSGVFPQTGEVIKKYSLYGGAVLIIGVIFFIITRRKKEEEA